MKYDKGCYEKNKWFIDNDPELNSVDFVDWFEQHVIRLIYLQSGQPK